MRPTWFFSEPSHPRSGCTPAEGSSTRCPLDDRPFIVLAETKSLYEASLPAGMADGRGLEAPITRADHFLKLCAEKKLHPNAQLIRNPDL